MILIEAFCSRHESASIGVDNLKPTGIQLERIKFDVFDGNIRNYPMFRTDVMKHVKPHHRAHEEAIVLKSYLSSKVRRDVENLDAAEEIWKRLDKRYGGEGKLVDSIMCHIKKMKGCRNTLMLIETLEKAYSDLKTLGMETEMSNSTIVGMVEERLPEDVMEKWVEIVTGDDRITIGRDKFSALMKLLLQFKERIEYRRSSMRAPEQRKLLSNAADAKISEQDRDQISDRKPPWRWLHPSSKDHPIWRCKLFEGKPSAEKVNLLRSNNACFSCLTIGHRMVDCWKDLKCRRDSCGMSHNTMLHEAYVSGISLHGKTLSDNGKTNEITLLLLQKILVKGRGEGRYEVGLNCLWDGGSNLSFITCRKAKQLQLIGSLSIFRLLR